jgi:hypothetical protein
MVPSSGASSPVSSFSSVVLPVPLAPTIPIRSPRWMRRVKSRMIVPFAETLGAHLVRDDHCLGLHIVD